MFGDFDLAAMGMPEEAWPQRQGKGKWNYTLVCPVNGTTIQVQMVAKAFWVVKGLVDGHLGVPRTRNFGWKKHGPTVADAWATVTRESGWGVGARGKKRNAPRSDN